MAPRELLIFTRGERRAYALLRPSSDQPHAQDRVRDLILQAYDELQSQIAVAS